MIALNAISWQKEAEKKTRKKHLRCTATFLKVTIQRFREFVLKRECFQKIGIRSFIGNKCN